MNDRQNYTLDIVGRIDEDIIDRATEYRARMMGLARLRRRRGIIGVSAIAALLVLVMSVLLIMAPVIFNTGTPSYVIAGIERISSAEGVDSYRITYADGGAATFTVTGGSGASGVSGVLHNDDGEMLIEFGSGNTLNLGNYVGKRDDDDSRDTNVGGITVDGEGAVLLNLVNHTSIGIGSAYKDRGDDNLTLSMARISEEGELILGFASGATVNLGRVVGKDGKDGVGISSIEISEDGELIITLTDGTEINLGRVRGEDGVGIAESKINDKGELCLTYTDGTAVNLGRVRGEDGVGVAKSEINEDGELCLTYTNGTLVNLGRVRGESGRDGRSAYEIYKDKYGYTGSESEWIDDLALGKLGTLPTYNVYFNTGAPVTVDAQEVVRGDKVEKPSDPSRPGYTFLGWYIDDEKWSFSGSSVTEDITLTAGWEIISYEIKYELEGGTGSSDNPLSYNVESEITLAAPSRPGYSFLGWYKDSGLSSRIEKIEKGSVGNITLYAGWSLISYPITYYSLGGSFSAPTASSYTVESAISLPVPTKENYTFAGWYTDENYRNPISEIPRGKTGPLSLYAKWTNAEYPIIYELCGGDSRGDNPESYTYGSTLEFAVPTRRGYNFLGWYKDEGYTEPIEGISSSTAGKLRIYAAWQIAVYSITYVMPDGVSAPSGNATSYTLNSGELLLTEPKKDNYYLRYWSYAVVTEDGTLPRSDYITAVPTHELCDLVIYATVAPIFSYKVLSETEIGITGYSTEFYSDACDRGRVSEIWDGVFPTSIDGYTVREICEGAFSRISVPEHLTFPESISAIGKNAFLECSSLKRISFPDTLSSIGDAAFRGCSWLENITLPRDLSDIGAGAFADCYRVEELYFNAVELSTTPFSGGVFSDLGCNTGGVRVTVGKGVTVIPEKIFYTDPYGTESGSPNVTSVEFETGSVCHTVGLMAFAYVESLKSIELPPSLLHIGDSAFEGAGIEKIIIPEAIADIGEFAFDGADYLSTVYYRGSEAEWADIAIASGNDPLISAQIRYEYTE